MTIKFYKEFGELGYLANYSNHGFYKDGIYYKTVEHYYQACKFDNVEIRNKIINADTPREASNIGRDRNNIRVDNFKSIKNQVMLEGILEKFRQNKDILYKLIDTKDEDIAEATVDEYYWGIGKDGSGENNIGKILVKVRNILKKELLDNIIDNCDDEVYILGSDDYDGIVSSYILSNILNKLNINSHFCILNSYTYDSDYNPEVVSDTKDKKFLLINTNIDNINKVGCISNKYYDVDNIICMTYDTTRLVIYNLFKDDYNFSNEELNLINYSSKLYHK